MPISKFYRPRKKEKIFKTGIIELLAPVSEFVLLMASGGVRRGDTDVEGVDDDEGKS